MCFDLKPTPVWPRCTYIECFNRAHAHIDREMEHSLTKKLMENIIGGKIVKLLFMKDNAF